MKVWRYLPVLVTFCAAVVACGDNESGPRAGIYVIDSGGSHQQRLTNGLDGLAYDLFPS